MGVGIILAASLIANAVLFGLLLWGITNNWIFLNRIAPFDAAAIGLASATLVLAATGAIVAVLTYVGFKQIRQKAVKQARLAARETADRVAREVAESVASRVARAALESPTTPADAEKLAELLE